jgi:hypothetical protein
MPAAPTHRRPVILPFLSLFNLYFLIHLSQREQINAVYAKIAFSHLFFPFAFSIDRNSFVFREMKKPPVFSDKRQSQR